MAKYYHIPKKLFKPKVVHFYDIVAVAVMLAAALTVLPLGTTLDFSAGFNEKSASYLELERGQLNETYDNVYFTTNYFSKLFETTTIQNGGTVYRWDENKYYFYEDGDQGRTYYPVVFGQQDQAEALTSAADDLPRGLIGEGNYIGVGDDGRIYLDDLEGLSGWTDHYVDQTAQPDPEAVTRLLTQNSRISAENAALVWSLTQRNILIGFSDGTVWFHAFRDGMSVIHRGTSDGIEEVYTVEGEMTDAMVAFNLFLFYIQDGNVHIHNLETGETLYFPNTTDWTELGEVRQIAYVRLNNGNIRLYTLNSVTSTYTDFTGVGTENNRTTTMNGINCQNYSEIFTTRDNQRFTFWFQDIGQIVWRHEEG